MNLEKHIGSLLFEHDCVIVPDFGGFVANYKSASVNPVQHSFTSPSKELIFNRNLKTNDGLLANHVAINEGLDYNRSMNAIRDCVNRYNKELFAGKRLVLTGLGVLYLDQESNIQFEPDGSVNYLTDSFGFSALLSLPIKREGAAQRIEKVFKDRESIPQTVAPKRQRKYGVYVAAAIIPLLALTVYISLQSKGTGKIDFSNLNPFSGNSVAIEQKQPITTVEKSVDPVKNTSSVESNSTNSNGANTTESIASNKTEGVANEANSQGTTPPVSTYVNTRENDIDQIEIPSQILPKGFHLVLGCFEKKSNAIRFAKKLRKENVTASIIGKNPRGLYVVSCGSYQTRTLAEQQKAIIKQSLPSVWLLAN